MEELLQQNPDTWVDITEERRFAKYVPDGKYVYQTLSFKELTCQHK